MNKPNKIKVLPVENNVDSELHFLCRYVNSKNEGFCLHEHMYYEIFMGVKGKYIHNVNSVKQQLSEGTLVFIRDCDNHLYERFDGKDFAFINIAFTKDFFESIVDFIGSGFKHKKLFNSAMPPMVNLPSAEYRKLFNDMMDINSQSDRKILKSKMKVMLAKIFTDYFIDYREQSNAVPLWLEITCEKMKKPVNLTSGIDRMCELSERSREHISRSMKKYYGISPSEFINELRLSYSSALLVTSRMSVTDICYESGFNNISWFYSKFEEKFGISPSKYRKMNQSDIESLSKSDRK